MKFSEYQEEAGKTAQYPDMFLFNGNLNLDVNVGYLYPVLGLCGEAGEVAEKVKKIIRNKEGFCEQKDWDEVKKELGDVLWYVAEICRALGFKMEDVAQMNLDKLKDRQERGVINSEGDNR